MMSTSRRIATLALLLCAGCVVAASAGGAARSRPAAVPTCALQLPNRLVNTNPRASTRLVPPGADSLSLCRYHGLNAGHDTGRLAASATIGATSTIAGLTRQFDALPRQRAGLHCPFDDGSAIIATFRYANAAADPVQVGLKGCRTVSNGRLTRTAISPIGPIGAVLVRRLERLLQPAETSAQQPCLSSQLAVSVQTQGENTTAWIGVTLQNRSRACTLTRSVGRVILRVEVDGHTASVRGNPLTLAASGRLLHGGTRLLIADWSNWCGARQSVRLTVTLGAARARARFSTLPVCLQPTQPSQLSAVH